MRANQIKCLYPRISNFIIFARWEKRSSNKPVFHVFYIIAKPEILLINKGCAAYLPASSVPSKVAEGGCKPIVNVVESELLVGRLQDGLQNVTFYAKEKHNIIVYNPQTGFSFSNCLLPYTHTHE